MATKKPVKKPFPFGKEGSKKEESHDKMEAKPKPAKKKGGK